jgi:hypothetical protein
MVASWRSDRSTREGLMDAGEGSIADITDIRSYSVGMPEIGNS